MPEPLHIALSANTDFTVPLGLCLRSIMQHAAPDTRYHFHILDSGIDRDVLMRGGFSNVTWYDVADKLRDLPAGGRFPTSVYHRYLLPLLLPPEIERALYLDCDSLVQCDLTGLFNTDMQGNALAAVPWLVLGNYRDEFGPHLDDFPQRFGLPRDGEPYFYSSLLLMNLPQMREMQASQRLISATHHYREKLVWPDQDVLNVTFHKQITPLPLKYNVIPLFAGHMEEESDDAKAAYANPAIIHFAATKPNILTGPRNEMEEKLFRFWQESPWAHRIPYPLVSLRSMPRPVAAMLNATFRLLLPWPGVLRAYGRLLDKLRTKKP